MIKLFKGIKFNNSYDYVKGFETKEERNNYFNNKEYILINDNNYIKEHINSFKVHYSHEYLFSNGINYIMFNNGYKDIFAFIIDKKKWQSLFRLPLDLLIQLDEDAFIQEFHFIFKERAEDFNIAVEIIKANSKPDGTLSASINLMKGANIFQRDCLGVVLVTIRVRIEFHFYLPLSLICIFIIA